MMGKLSDQTVETLYAKLPTTRLKAIAALHFELQYKQEVIGNILGVTQERIAQECAIIRNVLLDKPTAVAVQGSAYKPRGYKNEKTVSITAILRLISSLTEL